LPILDGNDDEYSTLSNPLNYFVLLAGFVAVPAGLGWYFYGGGKKRVGVWRKGKGRAYDKVAVEKV
jgi:hypothetical protein